MVNRQPRWNPVLGCWCMNFDRRVKMPSVKNFQMDEEDKASAMGEAAAAAAKRKPPLLMFGKCDEDVFALDFDPRAMSCVQAFAVALSSFERKYGL